MNLFIDLISNGIGHGNLTYYDEIFASRGPSYPILSDLTLKIINNLPVVSHCNGRGELVISQIFDVLSAIKITEKIEELSGTRVTEIKQKGLFFT